MEAFKLNVILLLMLTLSVLYMVDLRINIQYEIQLYGEEQEHKIRLNQERTDLKYELSRYSDAGLVLEIAHAIGLHEPNTDEVFQVKQSKLWQ